MEQMDQASEQQAADVAARADRALEEAENFCKAFLARFPSKPESSRLACDRSDTYCLVVDGQPTTGEGCIIDGLRLLDVYEATEPLYTLSILRVVVDWAHSQGWFAETQDAGTVKFYRL